MIDSLLSLYTHIIHFINLPSLERGFLTSAHVNLSLNDPFLILVENLESFFEFFFWVGFVHLCMPSDLRAKRNKRSVIPNTIISNNLHSAYFVGGSELVCQNCHSVLCTIRLQILLHFPRCICIVHITNIYGSRIHLPFFSPSCRNTWGIWSCTHHTFDFGLHFMRSTSLSLNLFER